MNNKKFYVDCYEVEYIAIYNTYIIRKPLGAVIGYVNGLTVCGKPEKLKKIVKNMILNNND